MALINIIFSILITLIAGKMIIPHIKNFNAITRLSIYYLAGNIVISLYMLLLALLKIKYNILTVSAPFILYALYFAAINIRPIKIRYKYKLNRSDLLKLIDSNNLLFLITMSILCLLVLAVFLNNLILPVFRADAIAHWLFKAKIFFIDKGIPFDTLMHKVYDYRADYPLLVPLNLTWVAICLNKWDDVLVRIFFSMQYLATIIIFYHALKEKTGKNISAISTLIVFALPFLLAHIENGYADFSLASYLLISMIFFHQWLKDHIRANLLLSSLFIGAAAWTKNDGIALYAILLFVFYLFINQNKVKLNKQDITYFILIPIFIFMPFKVCAMLLGLKSHMFTNWNLFAVIFSNLYRLPIILKAYLSELFSNAYQWGYFWWIFVVFLVSKRKSLANSNLRYILYFIGLSFLINFTIYLITPLEINFHIESSLGRTILSLAPLAGYLMFSLAFGDTEGKYGKIHKKPKA